MKKKIDKYYDWLNKRVHDAGVEERKTKSDYHEGFQIGLFEAYSEFCRVFKK